MFKVVWKSFKYNRKNFLSFFTSEILSVVPTIILIISTILFMRNTMTARMYPDDIRKICELQEAVVIAVWIVINVNMLIIRLNTMQHRLKGFVNILDQTSIWIL